MVRGYQPNTNERKPVCLSVAPMWYFLLWYLYFDLTIKITSDVLRLFWSRVKFSNHPSAALAQGDNRRGDYCGTFFTSWSPCLGVIKALEPIIINMVIVFANGSAPSPSLECAGIVCRKSWSLACALTFPGLSWRDDWCLVWPFLGLVKHWDVSWVFLGWADVTIGVWCDLS